MKRLSDSPIIVVASRWLAPFIQLFGLYVIFHGHYGPGGGFQGGVVLAASFVLMRLAAGKDASETYFRTGWGTSLSAIGTLLFVAIGIWVLLLGGYFLDFKFLPLLGITGAALRSLGILIVEVGVAIAVTATLVAIYDDLMGGEGDA